MDVTIESEFLERFTESFKRIDRYLRRSSIGDRADLIAESLYIGLEDSLVNAARKRATWREGVEADILQRSTRAFELVDMALESAIIAISVLDLEVEKPPQNLRYIFAGLSTRSLQVMYEIHALSRAGYTNGAKSRWRTLSEIRVVAGVLLLGGERTALRYKEHRGYLYARDHKRIYGSEEWEGPHASPDTYISSLSRRFGRAFCTDYGWAAELTRRRLGVKRPRWGDVQRLIEVSEHQERVLLAHHAVHGDSLGLLQVVDRSGIFNAGPDGNDVVSTLADAVYLFRQAVTSLVELWQTNVSSTRPLAILYLIDEMLLSVSNELLFLSPIHNPLVPPVNPTV